MRRRVALLLLMVSVVGTAPIAAISNPVITGTIGGVELCPEAICGQAIFAGNFAGAVNNRPTAGVFLAGITHELPLPTTINGTVGITGGSWLIRTRTRVFAGTVEAGGTLTYNGGNTFTVAITLDVTTGGSGTLTFTGLLDHNPFPPTIAGIISQ